MAQSTLAGLSAEKQYAAIEKTLKQYLLNEFCMNEDELNEIDEDTLLEDDLGLDSLDRVELVMYTERENHIHITDEEAESSKTIGELIACFIKHIEQ